MKTTRTIADLCLRSDKLAREKGWYDGHDKDPRSFSVSTALMSSEISEALEDWRKHRKMNEIYYEENKPCGIPIETADLVIRICQRVAGDGLALEAAMKAAPALPFGAGASDAFALLHFLISMAWAHDESILGPGRWFAHELTPTTSIGWLGMALSEAFAFAESEQFNLWAAIEEKEAYNLTRPQKHGNKKA
jgi:hypothetical protein